MLVTGSTALRQLIPLTRPVKDIDAIVWPSEVDEYRASFRVIKETDSKIVMLTEDGVHLEFEIALPGSNQEMLLNIVDNPSGSTEYAGYDILYLLKMSHRFLRNSPHFLKTMSDIRLMRAYLGYPEITPRLREWYLIRENDTYDYSHPSLNQSKQDFFSTDVFTDFEYKYDHDSLHEAVALLERPAYTYFQEGEVKTSRELFERCNSFTQLLSVYEESCVLALERSVIPHGSHPDKAFAKALEKVCTSIASGFWREFAWENYESVISLYKSMKGGYNQNYIYMFEQGLRNGTVKPFVKTS